MGHARLSVMQALGMLAEARGGASSLALGDIGDGRLPHRQLRKGRHWVVLKADDNERR